MITKCSLEEMDVYLTNKYNLFLCQASFESRCLSISKHISRQKVDKTIIFFMRDYFAQVECNKSLLEDYWGVTSESIELLHSDPIFSADNMHESLRRVHQLAVVENVIIDITTFTHESLLMLIKLIVLEFPSANITYVYANAKEYDAANNKDEKWLSKGIGDIRSVLGYPGDFLPAQKTHLIILVGYEVERATSIINLIEPSSLSLGYGRSGTATTDKDQDANEHYCHLIEQMSSSFHSITRFEVKCDDPLDTCMKIEAQIQRHEGTNIVIVPLNNKITTLGVALAAQRNPYVQLSYAPALLYNYADYSSPGDSCYVISNLIF